MLWLLAGDPGRAISNLVGSLGLARRGATLTLGVRVYFWLALAQYVAGAWDDMLLTAKQGFSAGAVLDQLRADSGQVAPTWAPALAWLEGWLAEQHGAADRAREIYQHGEQAPGAHSPVYALRRAMGPADRRLMGLRSLPGLRSRHQPGKRSSRARWPAWSAGWCSRSDPEAVSAGFPGAALALRPGTKRCWWRLRCTNPEDPEEYA